jgi:Domain of unknown function (DUF4440)
VLSEMQSFFQGYARAFDAGDVDRIASLHYAPCLKIHGDGSIECLSTPEAVRTFFRDLTGRYRARGDEHHAGRFLDLEVVPIGAQAALASLTWELQRKDGSVYRRFRRSYNIVRMGSDWKIVAATAHRDHEQA